MNWIGDNKILVFVGKRNTGKSVLVLDYLFHHQDLPFCACVSPTDEFNNTYAPHIPNKFIYDTYTPEIIECFLKRQKEISRKKTAALAGARNVDVRYSKVDPRGLLIMDDCLADAKIWKNDVGIKWIFMNGRHTNITLLLTMQYQVGIPPDLRVNVDYIFLCKETKRTEMDKLWKYYAGMFDNLDMFKQIHNKMTANHGVMVIDNTSNSDKLEDQVFYYRAQLREKGSFRVCYDKFWENNDYYAKNDLGGGQEEEDPYQRWLETRRGNRPNFDVGIRSNDGRP